jgi:hypothetical protein
LRASSEDAQAAPDDRAPINPGRVPQALGAEKRLPNVGTKLHRTPFRTGEVDWPRATIVVSAVPDSDVWCAANLLIQQHGADAEIVAAQRADELWEREDHDGQVVWLRIKRAIAELQASPSGLMH